MADSVEEGVDLILGGTTVATMGGAGVRIQDTGSTITLTSLDATLNTALISEDPRDFLINGFTGQTYSADSSTWNVTNWNGLDPVSLQLVGVPEPSGGLLVGFMLLSASVIRQRRLC